MRTRMLGIVGAVALAGLVAAPGALARAGDRTVNQTYPVATALCVKAHTGTLPAKLAPHTAPVITACDTLINAFSPLQVTVDAAESQFLGTVSTQKSLVASVCTKPVADHAACTTARLKATAAIAGARATEVTAVATFHAAVETNRAAFGQTIVTLRGGSSTTAG
jgi:hypothetical protein